MKVIYYVQAPCCAFPWMLAAGAPARNLFSSHVSQTGSISKKGCVLQCSLSCNGIWKHSHFSCKGTFYDV
jgi:hypothetical protein